MLQLSGSPLMERGSPLNVSILNYFQIKDLGSLKFCRYRSSSLKYSVLCQLKYALDIIEEAGMLDCKPNDTPMDPNNKVLPGQGEPLIHPGRY